MADGDDELDQQHGQSADELEGPEVDGQDAQGDLRQHDQTLSDLIARGEAAGFGGQTSALKRARKALRNTRAQIDAAEARGRARALEEFSASNGEAVDAIKQQVRQELAAQTSHARSLDRLGVPEPLRSMFDSISGDHKAYERQAALLHAAGVHWGDADPLVRQIGQQQVTQWQQAAQQNGDAVPLDPAAGVPAAVREQVIAEQVQSMAAAQAGAQPVDARSPAERAIEEAKRNPDLMLRDDARQSLADRFNAELDGPSRATQGGWG